MFDENLDPDNDAAATEGDNGEDANNDASATDDKSQQSDDSSQDIDWEKRYKGLQRASEKKSKKLEDELTKQKSDLESTVTELEEMRSDSGSLESKQKEAEEAKTKLEDDVQALQKEHDQLQTQINQQNIVMSEFPHLAPVAKFIPTAESDDDFRTGAKEFSDALTTMVNKGVETSLEGSSATFKKGDDDELKPSESELDEAWAIVYQYAGDPKHQKEYDEAYEKVMAADSGSEL
jgi:chromosome segregation ATPase